jgi:hypothetical protein
MMTLQGDWFIALLASVISVGMFFGLRRFPRVKPNKWELFLVGAFSAAIGIGFHVVIRANV